MIENSKKIKCRSMISEETGSNKNITRRTFTLIPVHFSYPSSDCFQRRFASNEATFFSLSSSLSSSGLPNETRKCRKLKGRYSKDRDDRRKMKEKKTHIHL